MAINKETLSFKIKDISTYRSELMGWAIIWIMMLHFGFHNVAALGFIAQYGYGGVEIFLLVSGFGLYYSLEKDGRPMNFYKKRLKRIFPSYMFICIFASIIIYGDGLLEYLYRCTTIGFWTGGNVYFGWYVPSIIALYIVAPFLKRLIDHRRLRYALYLASLAILILSFFLAKYQAIDRSHFFLVYRIPAFIFGMYCAQKAMKGTGLKPYLFILLAGLPLFAAFYPLHHQTYEFKYYSVLYLLPSTILVFCSLSKFLVFMSPLLQSFGKASLEIYLVQTIAQSALLEGMIHFPAPWHDACAIGLMAACGVIGIFIHWLINCNLWKQLLSRKTAMMTILII